MATRGEQKRLRVAALSLNQTPLDFRGNLERIGRGLQQARSRGALLVCLPELSISGYGAEDAFLWPRVAEQSLMTLHDLLPLTRGLVVAVGLPLWRDGQLYNAAAVVVNAKLLGFACKRHLAGDGIHYEPRWFKGWPAGFTAHIDLRLRDGALGRYPVGDWVFEVGGVRVGFEICEDAWVKARPGAELKQCGVDVILNPSASHFAFGKHEYRRSLVETGSREFECAYVYSNLLGNEAGRSIYDGDALIANRGQIVSSGERFVFHEHNLVVADLSLPLHGASSASLRPTVSADFDWSDAASPEPSGSAEIGFLSKEEEFGRVVALGLYDYARKSRSRGYVVSLSGGADSAACALLVRLMIRLAVRAKGLDAARADLGHPTAKSESELGKSVLTTVYQATAHSGAVTRAAASGLSEALGASHHEFDVDPLFRAYKGLGEQALGRDIEFPRDDLALQNLQARVRSPSVWLLANVQGAILVSTSNRSEAAVGYATMDGDTSGGLAPIAGIDKHYLRKWLLFMEKEGLPEWGPVPALRAINVQAPTAELRPPEYGQTDEADLMPYDVLNAAEAAFVSERGAPRDVFCALRERFPEHRKEDLLHWTRRFFQLFTRNQWKRERYAPSFHLDDRSLDPKTWCRFPILSGGFQSDLDDLD